MKKEDINQLHNTLLEILEFIKKICDENNLGFFLVYGTAIGACRHNGFIPWDDDLDIAMLRDDYEKFCHILHEQNYKDFKIQDINNEKNYFLTFAKVRKSGTIFKESIVDNMYENNGIFVDVFPLDYVKNKNSILFRIKRHLINYYKHILKFNACKNVFKLKSGKIKYILDCIISFPGCLMSNKKIIEKAEKLMMSNGTFEEAKYIVQYDETSFRAVMDKDIYMPKKMHMFEDKQYPVPAKLEKYLSLQYGEDFMTLPPEDKRTTHNPLELKF